MIFFNSYFGSFVLYIVTQTSKATAYNESSENQTNTETLNGKLLCKILY